MTTSGGDLPVQDVEFKACFEISIPFLRKERTADSMDLDQPLRDSYDVSNRETYALLHATVDKYKHGSRAITKDIVYSPELVAQGTKYWSIQDGAGIGAVGPENNADARIFSRGTYVIRTPIKTLSNVCGPQLTNDELAASLQGLRLIESRLTQRKEEQNEIWKVLDGINEAITVQLPARGTFALVVYGNHGADKTFTLDELKNIAGLLYAYTPIFEQLYLPNNRANMNRKCMSFRTALDCKIAQYSIGLPRQVGAFQSVNRTRAPLRSQAPQEFRNRSRSPTRGDTGRRGNGRERDYSEDNRRRNQGKELLPHLFNPRAPRSEAAVRGAVAHSCYKVDAPNAINSIFGSRTAKDLVSLMHSTTGFVNPTLRSHFVTKARNMAVDLTPLIFTAEECDGRPAIVFRSMEPTMKADIIKGWLRLWCGLVQFARATSLHEVRKMCLLELENQNMGRYDSFGFLAGKISSVCEESFETELDLAMWSGMREELVGRVEKPSSADVISE